MFRCSMVLSVRAVEGGELRVKWSGGADGDW